MVPWPRYDHCTATHGSWRCGNCGSGNVYWVTYNEPISSHFYIPPLPKLPPLSQRNRRWFHAFAEPQEPKALRAVERVQQALYRAQERMPLAQRVKWKRRRFVQGLACA